MSRDSVNRGTSAVKNVCKPVQLECLSTRILSWGAEEGRGKDTSIYMRQEVSEPPWLGPIRVTHISAVTVNNLEILGIFKDEDREEGDSVTDALSTML